MSNSEQLEYWNGEAGERWARDDDVMARLLQPVAELILEQADLGGCQDAIDVGCGGGSQSALLAQHLGAGSSVTGVDISGPLLGVARGRAAVAPAGSGRLEFLQADASDYGFVAGSFDLVFSRFGVMFFDDPIAAFSNISSALRPGAKLAFACWQSLQQNAWLWEPLQAALTLLPPPPAAAPDAPGPFSLADPQRIEQVLTAAGFADVSASSHRIDLCFDGATTLRDNARDLVQVGPINSLLEGQDEALREQVLDRVAEVLEPYYSDQALHLPGAIWLVQARLSD